VDNASKWNGFLRELSNLIFLWIFGILYFFLFRIVFIFFYRKELGESLNLSEYLNTFVAGFKFDCTVVAYFMIIPLLMTLVLSIYGRFELIRKVRIVFQYLFLFLSSLICVITINYYKEYNEQFNNFLFLGIYDDQKAILKTIIEYYNPVLNSLIIISIFVLGILVFRFFEKKNTFYKFLSKFSSKYARIGVITIVLLFFTVSIRGSLGRVPATRKWAAVSTDHFLNKTVINPFRCIKYAYDDFKEYNEIGKENPFGKEDLSDIYLKNTVSEVIEKEAHGEVIQKPKQIFLVIMESYDSWPLMDKYLPFGLSGNLSRIAENGTHFSNFLPSYHATFYGYSAIVSGIPYCGINTSLIGAMGEPYVTSIFNQFKKLGYKTNLFYGGFVSWSNIGNYTRHNGCDHIYTGADAGGKSESGDWGIEDEKLFDLVIEKLNPDEYTFNVILTSSYHAPYVVDVYKKGFTYQTENDLPEEVRKYYKQGMTFQELGHLWYGDWAIGKFMDKAEKKYQESLYGFTGDHFGRRFINHSPNLYERSSVPFILYGKDIPKKKINTPGSHIDILPTLIELVAPKDFKYYSFGTSMLLPDKKYGIGFEKMINTDSLYYFPKDVLVDEISLADFKESKTKTYKYKDDYKELMRLAWHYTVKGDSLKNK